MLQVRADMERFPMISPFAGSKGRRFYARARIPCAGSMERSAS